MKLYMNRKCVSLTLLQVWNRTYFSKKKNFFFNISHSVKSGFLFKKSLSTEGPDENMIVYFFYGH